MLKLWQKILKYPQSHFIRKLYENDRTIQSSRWAGKVKSVLKAYGLHEHWSRQSTEVKDNVKWSTKINKAIQQTFENHQKLERAKMPSANTMAKALLGRVIIQEEEKKQRKKKIKGQAKRGRLSHLKHVEDKN